MTEVLHSMVEASTDHCRNRVMSNLTGPTALHRSKSAEEKTDTRASKQGHEGHWHQATG